jgi:hypothetical protein
VDAGPAKRRPASHIALDLLVRPLLVWLIFEPRWAGFATAPGLAARLRLAFEKVNEIDAFTGGKYDFVLSNKEHGENVRG